MSGNCFTIRGQHIQIGGSVGRGMNIRGVRDGKVGKVCSQYEYEVSVMVVMVVMVLSIHLLITRISSRDFIVSRF